MEGIQLGVSVRRRPDGSVPPLYLNSQK
ncbi:MAG: hypothetical protein ACI97A_003566, partial [Planctomycetota bacterium]